MTNKVMIEALEDTRKRLKVLSAEANKPMYVMLDEIMDFYDKRHKK